MSEQKTGIVGNSRVGGVGSCAAAVALIVGVGCSQPVAQEELAVGLPTRVQVSLEVKGGNQSKNTGSGMTARAASAIVADSCGISLTSAQLVLASVELRGAELESEEEEAEEGEDTLAGESGETTETEDVEETEDTADSEDAEDADEADEDSDEGAAFGPFLIDIAEADFAGAVREAVLDLELPSGAYDELRLEVRKLDDGDPLDAAAAAADADLAEMMAAQLSVRLAGTLEDGTPFAFTSEVGQEQESAVNVVIGDDVSGIDGITFSVDPSGWFVDKDTAACLDPSSEESRSPIEENIKNSLDVEEDDDHDGLDDESEDDDGGDGDVEDEDGAEDTEASGDVEDTEDTADAA